MDDRLLAAAFVIALLLGLLALMYLGWRKRQRSQSELPAPLPVPNDPGTELIRVNGLYVASTLVDDPLNRVAVSGLGYRARASVGVFESGIVLRLAGERDAFLPATDVIAVGRSTWTIDRVVESGGLVRITWRLGDTVLDSFIRITEQADPTALIRAIETITEAASHARNEEK